MTANKKQQRIKYKTGDPVRLKRGGPTMIVKQVVGQNVKARWISGLVTHNAIFDTDLLRRTATKSSAREILANRGIQNI
jgi:uncharacterized protein YodC (DUF2158 family)